jgi:hypothetical protein
MELRQRIDHRQQPARCQRPGTATQEPDLAAGKILEDIERSVVRAVRRERREQRGVIDDSANEFTGHDVIRAETQHDVTVGMGVPCEPRRAVVPGRELPRQLVSRSHDLPACERRHLRHRSGLSACRRPAG